MSLFHRQALANAFGYRDVAAVHAAYIARDTAAIAAAGASLQATLHDLDGLLATQELFLLGKWLAEARSSGDDGDRLEYNACNQVFETSGCFETKDVEPHSAKIVACML